MNTTTNPSPLPEFMHVDDHGTVLVDLTDGDFDRKLPAIFDVFTQTASSRLREEARGRIEYRRFAQQPGVTIHPDGVIEIPIEPDYDKLTRISRYLIDQLNSVEMDNSASVRESMHGYNMDRKWYRDGHILLTAVIDGEVSTEPTREWIAKLIDARNREDYD